MEKCCLIRYFEPQSKFTLYAVTFEIASKDLRRGVGGGMHFSRKGVNSTLKRLCDFKRGQVNITVFRQKFPTPPPLATSGDWSQTNFHKPIGSWERLGNFNNTIRATRYILHSTRLHFSTCNAPSQITEPVMQTMFSDYTLFQK